MNTQDITNIKYAKASQLSIGTQSDAPAQLTTTFYQNTTVASYQNVATSGSHLFKTLNSVGGDINSLDITSTSISTPLSFTSGSISTSAVGCGAITTSGSISLSASSLFIQTSTSSANLVVGTAAGGGGLYLMGRGFYTSVITNTDFKIYKNLTMDAASARDRIINSVFYQFQDQAALGTQIGQVYGNTGVLYYDNSVNLGSHKFSVRNNVAGIVTPLELTYLNVTFAVPVNMSSQDINSIKYARAAQLSIGTQSEAPGQATTTFYQLAAVANYQNVSVSGSHLFKTLNSVSNTSGGSIFLELIMLQL